ncbi:MAG TPA: prepilin-type cleavage/methylation domain-containing protein [Gammaproteobacteria bacterium]|nr:prepilin-type cleavage/methylation domain-containing protein [Gammaproteobacteria bacterium]
MTLIELMLVVALTGLLAAVAYPSYTGYIERSRISRAVGDIGAMSLQLARWRASFGDFPPTLAAAGLDGRLDPWGAPYEYLNVALANPGKVRRDKNLNPVNTDYDLYSRGKDGETVTAFTAKKARDDVVRANNGGFIGLAQDY